MKKAYILNSCSTCQRIIKEIDWQDDIQNIKEEAIEPEVLDAIAKEHGSYESLFSRRAMKYKSMGLKNKDLSEKDYRNLILEEYTFLKRPVFIIDGRSFVGNSKAVVEEIKNYLKENG